MTEKKNNIFENAMDEWEFMEKISEKIAEDWKEENMDSDDNLYQWLYNGFIEGIKARVTRRLE